MERTKKMNEPEKEFFDELMQQVSSIEKSRYENTISASEALYGFIGWLTSRDEVVIFSAHHTAGKAADSVALFCKVNDLAEPRNGWDKKMILPKEPNKPVAIGGVTAEDRPPSPWRPHLEEILSKLSGTLSHDNVAAAKEILKKILD